MVCIKDPDPHRFEIPEQVFVGLKQTPASSPKPDGRIHPETPSPLHNEQGIASALPQHGDLPPSYTALNALYRNLLERQRMVKEAKENEQKLQKSSRLVLFHDTVQTHLPITPMRIRPFLPYVMLSLFT